MHIALKKSFLTALAVASVAGAYAAAPVISALPDINVGDQEQNGVTDNNFFIYTGVFAFDSFVTDSDTTVSDLRWTFDEGSPTPQWYTVNGQNPHGVGDPHLASEASSLSAFHITGSGATNLRAISSVADFRDIVYSPTPDALPYPTPDGSHAAGKFVRFYASDGVNVASRDAFVKTVDNSFDAISGGNQFQVVQNDTFTTGDPSPTGWSFSGTTGQTGSYNIANGALVGTLGVNTGERQALWQSEGSNTIPYSFVGSANVARAKYYVYAGGNSPATANTRSNLRIRLQQRFAINSMLEVLHATNDVEVETSGADIAPSTNPAQPSLYRVDYDPIETPIQVSQASQAASGIQRGFEGYNASGLNYKNGFIALTESTIGTYPRTIAVTGSPVQTFAPSASNAGSLSNTVGGSGPVEQSFQYDGTNFTNVTTWTGPPAVDGVSNIAYSEGTFGVTLNTTAVASDFYGISSREFLQPAVAGTLNARLRAAEGKFYTVRFHATSTQQVNQQAQVRFRARSIKFNWSQKLEIGGAYPTNGATAQAFAQQALPGVGSQNPDKIAAENGGWYTLIMHTPLSQDIRPDVAGSTIAQKMPALGTLPGNGVNASSRLDINFGTDLFDAQSNGVITNKPLERGDLTVDRVEVYVNNINAD